MEPNTIPRDQDEISISELLMRLWVKRGLIVFLPLVLAGLTIVGLLAVKTKSTQENLLSYYVEFNGIAVRNTVGDKEMAVRYPNGVVFSPQDLTNPAVIADLASQYGVRAGSLAANIDVEFGSPMSAGVVLEYEATLSANENSGASKIAAINRQYQQRISAIAKRGLKVSVDFVALELSRERGKQLAIDLPRTWSRIFTTQFKTRFIPEIITQTMPRYELDLSSMLGFLAAEKKLNLIQKGISTLARDGRLAGLTDETGASAADLLGYIEDFRAVHFDRLYLTAFSQRSRWSDLYLKDMQREVDMLSEEIEELNRRLNDLQEYRRGGNQLADLRGIDINPGGSSAQPTGIAFSELVSLARQADLSSYLKETLDQRTLMSSQRSDVQRQILRITDASGEDNMVMSEEFVQVAVARYQHVIAGYSKLIELARDMLIRQTPTYFSPITQPATPPSTPLLTRSGAISLALALALGVMLAIMVALLWPQREE